MNKKQKFIDFVKALIEETNHVMDEDVEMYWNALCADAEEKEKPLFTDNGKLILKFLQDHQDTQMWKAKDIAEELFVNSRMVSGAMRKLVTDEFVEKVGTNPTIYVITEKGKNINID
jgi:DNA-binding MarR family transcriptional regulator